MARVRTIYSRDSLNNKGLDPSFIHCRGCVKAVATAVIGQNLLHRFPETFPYTPLHYVPKDSLSLSRSGRPRRN